MMTIISNSSFYGCNGLKGSFKLNIPNSIKIIQSYSFYNCSNFNENLILPSELEIIGKQSFGLTNFAYIEYKGIKEPTCDENIGLPFDQIIHVPTNYQNKTFCNYKIDKFVTPTIEPSKGPTAEPTIKPTVEPTAELSVEPSIETSIEPSYEPSNNPGNNTKLSKGIIACIVISCILLILAVALLIVFKLKRRIKQPNINPTFLLEDE